MPTFHVTWEMDIEADTPLEAARLAVHYQTKPGTTANVFDVQEHSDLGIIAPFHIDLTAIEEDEDGHCRTCGQPYEDGGDGYDGECPDCADTTEAEHNEAECKEALIEAGWREATAEETKAGFCRFQREDGEQRDAASWADLAEALLAEV